jgi:glucose/arabinose dehydrogenase
MLRRWIKPTISCAAAALAALMACSDDPVSPADLVECAADNGGITLPPDFCAVVVADLVVGGAPAAARHMVLTPDGDLFVAINSPGNEQPAFGIVGLRDNDGDGTADEQTEFSPGLGGSGLAWRQGVLYFGANDQILRFPLPSGQLTPAGGAQVVVSGLPNTGDHISKTILVPNAQTLYVNIGSASNSCQVSNREEESPGVFPCPELPVRAGIWVFDPGGTNQTQAAGDRFATGYRNMVALAINPFNNGLYGVQHGRDRLFEDWGDFFTQEDDAVLPAEELVRITESSDNGWPYCYYDAITANAKVLAPEYGGNGELVTNGTTIDCADHNDPLATFGAHWAPNGMTFYSGDQFPERYRRGLFIAFHGGFDRAPLPNEGYNVMFVPMGLNGLPSGEAEVFANGFAGSTGPLPQSALHRPVGITEGPDGSLYVSDDKAGRIYRIVYKP